MGIEDEVLELRKENAKLRADLVVAFGRITAASEVLGKAAERAAIQGDYKRADELSKVKDELSSRVN